jgi:hypothetical protein
MKSEATRNTSRHRARASSFRLLVVILVACALALGASSLAGAASAGDSSSKISARLTVTQFAIYESSWVKLTYKLPKASKAFTYKLTWSKGSATKIVASGTKKKGRSAMPISKLFGGKKLIVGKYQLDLSAAGAHKRLAFTIIPFSGHLTMKSFTVTQAASIKLFYAFSKPSKSFAYKLYRKKGSAWQLLSSHKTVRKAKSQYYIAQKTASLKSLFARKPFTVASYRLKISSSYATRILNFKIISGGPSGTSGGTGIGGNGSGNGGTVGIGFTISGGVSNLGPGVPKPIALTLTNPNDFKIYVTALTVAMSTSSLPAGCQSSWFQLTQSSVSNSNAVTVPAKGSTTVASAPLAPQIELIDSPTDNQDACKSASFTLTFSGSAHS